MTKQPVTLEELYEHLKHLSRTFPVWIEKVDADVSDEPRLWGEKIICLTLKGGRKIWLKDAKQ